MHNRIGLILLAVAFSFPVLAQETASTSRDGFLTSGTAKRVKSAHHHETKVERGAPHADRASRVAPDIAKNDTTGAAAGIARPPPKADPDVHTLNSILPP